MFDGFEDPIIATVCKLPYLKSVCEAGNIPKRIGFFYGVRFRNFLIILQAFLQISPVLFL